MTIDCSCYFSHIIGRRLSCCITCEISSPNFLQVLLLLVPSLFCSFYYEQIRRKDGLRQTRKLNNIEWSWCQLSPPYCIIRPFNKIGSYFIGHFKGGKNSLRFNNSNKWHLSNGSQRGHRTHLLLRADDRTIVIKHLWMRDKESRMAQLSLPT